MRIFWHSEQYLDITSAWWELNSMFIWCCIGTNFLWILVCIKIHVVVMCKCKHSKVCNVFFFEFEQKLDNTQLLLWGEWKLNWIPSYSFFLGGFHLQLLVVIMYAQKLFTFDNFPYQVVHGMVKFVQVKLVCTVIILELWSHCFWAHCVFMFWVSFENG